MEKNLAGIAYLEKIPDVLFIPALQREVTAVEEGNSMNVPIVGVCDTNADPSRAQYIIPANDDAVNAIKMIVGLVADAVKEGKAEYERNKKKEVVKEKTVRTSKKELDWN